LITTTPRPTKLIKDIIGDPSTVVTRGRTLDNSANLAPSFIQTIVRRYEGTRIGRQELDAEILDDVVGALFKLSDIEATRYRAEDVPTMRRIVVAIDPAMTSNEGSDETGIIVCGLGADGRGYVLEDRSGKYTPDQWAREACVAYYKWRADRIIGEVNQGGDLIERTLRTVDGNVAYKSVHASRGRTARAEPVAALYEQRRVSHVGIFTALEDQMCAFVPDAPRKDGSPDRCAAAVWGLSELMITQFSGAGLLRWYEQEAE
jgi:phage terminase large subunit-like protein